MIQLIVAFAIGKACTGTFLVRMLREAHAQTLEPLSRETQLKFTARTMLGPQSGVLNSGQYANAKKSRTAYHRCEDAAQRALRLA